MLDPMRKPIIISQCEMYILQRYLARRQIWFSNLNEQLSRIKKITFTKGKRVKIEIFKINVSKESSNMLKMTSK